jgi:ATP-dependent RNA helicase RhlE
MQFDQLQLSEPLLRAVRAEGYTDPTPIQVQAIPPVMTGRDLLGCAQTGSGKTAAFALPILQRLIANGSTNGATSRTTQNSRRKPQKPRHLRVLVLSPTRELASQIGDSFKTYGKFTDLRHVTIFGGVKQHHQVVKLQRGADILVATPGRLLDLMGQGYVKLDRLEVLVLDEADRMLDMGFIHDVRRIIDALPTKRQTLLFSATMPGNIQTLANSILNNPAYVAVTPSATTVETIQQSIYFVEKKQKIDLLKHLLRDPSMKRVLVFSRTKHGANKIVRKLGQASIEAAPIHGNKSQAARERALANFKSGSTRVLVATDIAARGIDVDHITHVINYDLPNESETYVHRIGRTARAGASGIAYSFCMMDERPYLVDIERLIQTNIPVAEDYPYASNIESPSLTDLSPRRNRSSRAKSNPQSNPSGRNQNNRRRRNTSSSKRSASNQSRRPNITRQGDR